MKRFFRDENGAAAAELAILGPVFAVLIAGVIEVGGIVQDVQVVRNAAREGARYAAVSDSDPAGKALNYLTSTFGSRTDITLPAKSSITVSGTGLGNPVTVTVPLTVKIDAPVIQNLFGSSLGLNSSATMRITQ